MKYLWTTFAGFLLGVAIGIGLLLVNPLTGDEGRPARDSGLVLRYAWPDDTVALTHGGRAPFRMQPADVGELWEATVRGTAVMAAVLSGAGSDQPRAVATRVATPSKRTELLRRGVIIDDHWLVTVPGEGSFFVVAESNVWPVVKDTLLPVTLLGRSWQGPRDYSPTTGPDLARVAVAVGATGAYAGKEGSAVERLEVRAFTRNGGFEAVAGELRVELRDRTKVLDDGVLENEDAPADSTHQTPVSAADPDVEASPDGAVDPTRQAADAQVNAIDEAPDGPRP